MSESREVVLTRENEELRIENRYLKMELDKLNLIHIRW